MTSQTLPPSIERYRSIAPVEYPRNPRTNDSAVDRMSSSIREFGFKISVLARSDGEISDGHRSHWYARKASPLRVVYRSAGRLHRYLVNGRRAGDGGGCVHGVNSAHSPVKS